MPETDKFQVFKYKIYVLAVCIFPNFILPTFDSIERFFSSAGYAYNDYQKNLLPIIILSGILMTLIKLLTPVFFLKQLIANTQ